MDKHFTNERLANEMHREINRSRHVLYYLVADIWIDAINYLRSYHEETNKQKEA